MKLVQKRDSLASDLIFNNPNTRDGDEAGLAREALGETAGLTGTRFIAFTVWQCFKRGARTALIIVCIGRVQWGDK